MADTAISAFNQKTAPTGVEDTVVADAGQNYRVKVGHTARLAGSEFLPTGKLVFPYITLPSTTGDPVTVLQTTYGTITYTMTLTYTGNDVTQRVVTNNSNANTDTQLITYNPDGTVASISDWIRT